jgi:hypothetical protein
MCLSTTRPPCSDRCEGYVRALYTFHVAALMDCLSAYSDPDFDAAQMHLQASEVEALAALLVQQLTRSLTGRLLASLLHVLRQADPTLLADLPTFAFKQLQPLTPLPAPMLQASPAPKFADGTSVRWLTWQEAPESQTGIILGHCYAYARHRRQWTWQYLVWLRQPLGRVMTDTAWETDLEVWTEVQPHD